MNNFFLLFGLFLCLALPSMAYDFHLCDNMFRFLGCFAVIVVAVGAFCAVVFMLGTG